MRRPIRVVALAAVTGVALTAPLAASADTRPPARELTTTTEDLSGRELARAIKDRSTDAERAEVAKEFVNEQARDGRLLDIDEVETVVSDNIVAAWSENIEVESITVETTSAKDAPEAVVAEEITILSSFDGGDADEETALTAAGLTMGAGNSLKGGKLIHKDCMDATTKRQPGHSGNVVSHCYEKYKLSHNTSKKSYWHYNRYGTAYGGTSSLKAHFKPIRFELASRPHKDFRARTTGMVGYWPHDGKQACAAERGSINVTFKTFGLKVPIASCSNVHPNPLPSSKKMGVTWASAWPYTGSISKGVDFGMTVEVSKPYVPYFGDLASAKFCDAVTVCGNSTTSKDAPGW